MSDGAPGDAPDAGGGQKGTGPGDSTGGGGEKQGPRPGLKDWEPETDFAKYFDVNPGAGAKVPVESSRDQAAASHLKELLEWAKGRKIAEAEVLDRFHELIGKPKTPFDPDLEMNLKFGRENPKD